MEEEEEEGAGVEERFTGPARPRLRYERPKEARDLPGDVSRWRYCTSLHPLSPLSSASTNLHYLVFRNAQISPSRYSQSPSGRCSSSM